MALNSSGPISLVGCCTGVSIRKELGASGALGLTCASVRGLAGVASGAITMPGNFYGKSTGYSQFVTALVGICPNPQTNCPRGAAKNSSGFAGIAVNGSTIAAVGTYSPGVNLSNGYFPGYGYAACTAGNASLIAAYTTGGIFKWAKTIKSSGSYGNYNQAFSSAVDSSGNIYASGLSNQCSGAYTHWFAKLNGCGSVVWQKKGVVGNSGAVPTNAQISGCSVYFYGMDNITPAGPYVAKFSLCGTYQSSYTAYFSCNGNSTTSYGGIYNPNTSYSYHTVYIPNTAGAVQYKVGLIQVDPTSGAIGWTHFTCLAVYNQSTGGRPVYDSSNNLYFAFTQNAGFIIRSVDSSGNYRWGKVSNIQASYAPWYGSWYYNGNTTVQTLAVDSSDNIYWATGMSSSRFSRPGIQFSMNSGAILKFDKNGTLLWQRTIASPGNIIQIQDITVNNNNIYVSGYFRYQWFANSADEGVSGNWASLSPTSAFVVKMPADGSLQGYVSGLASGIGGAPSQIGGLSFIIGNGAWTLSNHSSTTNLSLTKLSRSTFSSVSCATQLVFSSPSCLATPNSQFTCSTRAAYFTSPGRYNWVAPAGASSVSYKLIGAGGVGGNSKCVCNYCGYYGGHYKTYVAGGGGGGGAALAGTDSVTAGSCYLVQVGFPDSASTNHYCYSASIFMSHTANGGHRGCCGIGGLGGTAVGGSTGGKGGNQGRCSTSGGGGGAAGFCAPGGNGGDGLQAGSNGGGPSGTGSSAAGGGGGGTYYHNGAFGGGGVCIFFGSGPAGTAGNPSTGGAGGQSGGVTGCITYNPAVAGRGGAYGGGGGGGGTLQQVYGGEGGPGAVKLTW